MKKPIGKSDAFDEKKAARAKKPNGKSDAKDGKKADFCEKA